MLPGERKKRGRRIKLLLVWFSTAGGEIKAIVVAAIRTVFRLFSLTKVYVAVYVRNCIPHPSMRRTTNVSYSFLRLLT